MYEFYEIDCLKYKTNRRFQTVIFDPPYGLGMNYIGKFNDSMEYFNQNIDAWVANSVQKMAENGSWFGFIIGEDHYYLWALAKKAKLQHRRTLQWFYEFGQDTEGNFTSLTTPILYMVKDPDKAIWNKDAVKLPSARMRYGDKRAKMDGKGVVSTIVTIGGHVIDIIERHDPGTFFETLLSYPRIMGNFTERAKFSPNQLPVEMLMRLIACTTNVGDWVYDPNGGSGSTAIACELLHRNCVLCDPFTAEGALEHIEKYREHFCKQTGLPFERPREWTSDDPVPLYREGKWGYHKPAENREIEPLRTETPQPSGIRDSSPEAVPPRPAQGFRFATKSKSHWICECTTTMYLWSVNEACQLCGNGPPIVKKESAES